MSDLYQPHSALELLQRFEGNVEARRRYLHERFDRIREFDVQLEAMTAVPDPDAAMQALENVRGPLGGLPVAIKDIFDTHDLVTAYGSPIYAGHRPASDATIVTLLRRQGAVSIGKTVTCEFAYMAPTPTRNPCALNRTAGGSSSGSAAAVAAGYAPFAIGSQTAGSTIRPASFCGVAGYKPTFGLLPTLGMKCFSWSFDTVGLFASGVRDVAHLAQVLSGRRLAVSGLPVKPVFGLPESYPWASASVNATVVVDRAVHAIEAAGAVVKPVEFAPWMTEMTAAHATIQSYESFQTLGFEYDHHRERLTLMLRDFLDRAADVTADAYTDACAKAEAAKTALLAWFDGIDALLTPSALDEAPDGLASTGDPAFSRNWTLLGTPCVSVPGLRGERGGPIGVQVIGRRGGDAATLALAAFVEATLKKA
jgi:Asp-tRNA(Asn)/Glu-tRNA(Gln) amidotransferase A subunit family amidase